MEESNKRRKLSLKKSKSIAAHKSSHVTRAKFEEHFGITPIACTSSKIVDQDLLELRKRLLEWQLSQSSRPDVEWSTLADLPGLPSALGDKLLKEPMVLMENRENDVRIVDNGDVSANNEIGEKRIVAFSSACKSRCSTVEIESVSPGASSKIVGTKLSNLDAVAATSKPDSPVRRNISSCPICQVEFSVGQTQIEMDAHIALCLSSMDGEW